MAKKRASIADADLFQTTEESQDVNIEESQDVKTQKEPKFKTTLYITKETQFMLDQAWVDLRRITGVILTKTDIIEAALNAALADGEYSEVIKRLDVK